MEKVSSKLSKKSSGNWIFSKFLGCSTSGSKSSLDSWQIEKNSKIWFFRIAQKFFNIEKKIWKLFESVLETRTLKQKRTNQVPTTSKQCKTKIRIYKNWLLSWGLLLPALVVMCQHNKKDLRFGKNLFFSSCLTKKDRLYPFLRHQEHIQPVVMH